MLRKPKRYHNYLLEKVVSVCAGEPRGKLLDLGCGDGMMSKRLADMGFDVVAADMDRARFRFSDKIKFSDCDLGVRLPFGDAEFDCILFLEVIEHIYNPGFVISEICRVLRPGGVLILSTPNILNIGSRIRFLVEGSFDFFREPTLDYVRVFPAAIWNMHVIPWRYQELEYLLAKNGLQIHSVHTDLVRRSLVFWGSLLKPFVWLQGCQKALRSARKGGVDYRRINRILLSPELFFGRHLVVKALK